MLEKLNECTNLIALFVLLVGATLIIFGHADSGMIAGSFAIITAASKKNQQQ